LRIWLPIANDDSYTVAGNTVHNEVAPGVLSNDTDMENDGLTAVLDSNVANGVLSFALDGSFVYTPTVNFCGTDGFTYHANDGANNSGIATVTLNVTCQVELIYVSSSSSGSVGGVSFADEDILVHDVNTGDWAIHFDGSDVGLGWSYARDVDAFHLLDDNSILLSFVGTVVLPNVGKIDDSDLVRFIPSSLGATTVGTFEMYFDGSDVGLSHSGEDVDSIFVAMNGDLLLSTTGKVRVANVKGRDEDILRFSPNSLGANTNGSWTMEFDGSDVGLGNSGVEDVWGLWVDENTMDIHLTTQGPFNIPGLSGNGADVFVCGSPSSGPSTSCTYSMLWDGSTFGYGSEKMDGLFIERP